MNPSPPPPDLRRLEAALRRLPRLVVLAPLATLACFAAWLRGLPLATALALGAAAWILAILRSLRAHLFVLAGDLDTAVEAARHRAREATGWYDEVQARVGLATVLCLARRYPAAAEVLGEIDLDALPPASRIGYADALFLLRFHEGDPAGIQEAIALAEESTSTVTVAIGFEAFQSHRRSLLHLTTGDLEAAAAELDAHPATSWSPRTMRATWFNNRAWIEVHRVDARDPLPWAERARELAPHLECIPLTHSLVRARFHGDPLPPTAAFLEPEEKRLAGAADLVRNLFHATRAARAHGDADPRPLARRTREHPLWPRLGPGLEAAFGPLDPAG